MYFQVYLARSNSDNEWYRVLVVARYKNMQGKLNLNLKLFYS